MLNCNQIMQLFCALRQVKQKVLVMCAENQVKHISQDRSQQFLDADRVEQRHSERLVIPPTLSPICPSASVHIKGVFHYSPKYLCFHQRYFLPKADKGFKKEDTEMDKIDLWPMQPLCLVPFPHLCQEYSSLLKILEYCVCCQNPSQQRELIHTIQQPVNNNAHMTHSFSLSLTASLYSQSNKGLPEEYQALARQLGTFKRWVGDQN